MLMSGLNLRLYYQYFNPLDVFLSKSVVGRNNLCTFALL